MKKLLIISDFIENQPVVASVRYCDLMPYISKKFFTIVINDEGKGNKKSIYSNVNFKYNISKSKFTQRIELRNKKRNLIETLLRNKLILTIWRNYSNSFYCFRKKNIGMLKELDDFLLLNSIEAIFITVPDIHGLYILDYIKRKHIKIPAIVEVRDILNNKIGGGNPSYTLKNAERILINRADGIIALSNGIEEYYKKFDTDKKIRVITNGYNAEDFKDCKYESINNKNEITLAHVGSIYKGRNIKDFISALIKLSKTSNINVVFNEVGFLDSEAIKDIEELSDDIKGSKVKVNILGTMSHEEAIKYLIECDISVILTHKIGSEYAIPGKTFEYIGASKPIIAVTKDKNLIELIDGKFGECAEHKVDKIEEKLQKLLKTHYDFENRFQFSREIQSNNIINFIEEVAPNKED